MEKIARKEILLYLDGEITAATHRFLKPVETIWQPADLLPHSDSENFFDDLRQLQQRAAGIPDDLLAVLIGDTITEEALPTYESWLTAIKTGNGEGEGWNQWIRSWTAEENRHGDTLSAYLYLCGRVDMRAVQVSTQYLLGDGFDVGTARDPYKSFVYTSFQELATNLSHRRVAQLAKSAGDDLLAKICGHVCADEARHARAYKSFVSRIFEIDPSGMMLAFADMMKKSITMPAHFLREAGHSKGSGFIPFAAAAERTGVYTRADYINILLDLIEEWKTGTITALSSEAEQARDFIMGLPKRLQQLCTRNRGPKPVYNFAWIIPQ